MSSTLSQFMSIAITVIILFTIVIGVSYGALVDKDQEHKDHLRTDYNLQMK